VDRSARKASVVPIMFRMQSTADREKKIGAHGRDTPGERDGKQADSPDKKTGCGKEIGFEGSQEPLVHNIVCSIGTGANCGENSPEHGDSIGKIVCGSGLSGF